MTMFDYLILMFVCNYLCAKLGTAWGRKDRVEAKNIGMYAFFFTLGILLSF